MDVAELTERLRASGTGKSKTDAIAGAASVPDAIAALRARGWNVTAAKAEAFAAEGASEPSVDQEPEPDAGGATDAPGEPDTPSQGEPPSRRGRRRR